MVSQNNKNNLRNVGLMAIAAGSALAIYVFRDEIFADSGTTSGNVLVNSIQHNTIIEDPVLPSFLVGGNVSIVVENTGDTELDVGLEVRVVSSSPGQNLNQNVPIVERSKVPPGTSLPLNIFWGLDQAVIAPGNLEITYTFKSNNLQLLKFTESKVLREDGQIVDRF